MGSEGLVIIFLTTTMPIKMTRIDVAKAIKNFKPYTTSNKWTHNNNFPIGDCHRRDLEQESAKDYYVGRGLVSEVDFTMFEDNIPYGEYGIHTITSIRILLLLIFFDQLFVVFQITFILLEKSRIDHFDYFLCKIVA